MAKKHKEKDPIAKAEKKLGKAMKAFLKAEVEYIYRELRLQQELHPQKLFDCHDKQRENILTQLHELGAVRHTGGLGWSVKDALGHEYKVTQLTTKLLRRVLKKAISSQLKIGKKRDLHPSFNIAEFNIQDGPSIK